WGRGHVTAESPHFALRTQTVLSLQWGRGHVTAESSGAAPKTKGQKMASMGPRSRDRGIPFLDYDSHRNVSLQWGRGHVTAESTLPIEGTATSKTLQWGRGHVTAESRLSTSPCAKRAELQWGRGHVTAESPLLPHTPSSGALASMGPRSRDRGIGHR